MPRNGFDRIAPFYDHLVWLFFGNQIQKSQTFFLPSIPPRAKVLVMGGGTGWIIPRIMTAQPNCRIWFIDSSMEMIRRAKARNPDNRAVIYIPGTSSDVPKEKFDIVILPFFLDLFSPHNLKENLLTLSWSTTSSTQWFVTDFVDHGKWWERILLTWMYLFFGLTCSIEARRLPPWQRLLENLDFKRQQSRVFYNGFIESNFYLRN